jgi:hypothetical protein
VLCSYQPVMGDRVLFELGAPRAVRYVVEIVVRNFVGRGPDVDATARGACVFLNKGDLAGVHALGVEQITTIDCPQDFVECPLSLGLVGVIADAHGDNMSLFDSSGLTGFRRCIRYDR